MSRWTRIGAVTIAAALVTASATAQGPSPSPGPVFPPLLADPQEPRFFASYGVTKSSGRSPPVAAVGFGQTIGLWRARDWQLSVAAGTSSQFDLGTNTNDLMNTDYLVGFPLAYRRGRLAARFRIYHFSSHLGDGWSQRGFAEAFRFGYDAIELLLAHRIRNSRVYGGGEYRFRNLPHSLEHGALHAGIEYRSPRSFVGLGRLGAGRLVIGLDSKSFENRNWQVAFSFVTGLEMIDPAAPWGAGPRWTLLLKAYTGAAPQGQFYRNNLSSVALAVECAL